MRVVCHFLAWYVGLSGPGTQTTEAERECLARHAADRRRLVEIGVWHGVTTCRLRAAMSPDGELWAVDPFPPGRLGFSAQRYIARREVARVRNGSVRWLRLTGIEAAHEYATSDQSGVEFVFIDGDHSYEGALGDWRAWSALTTPGGIVTFHDSRSTAQRHIDDAGSARVVREIVCTDPEFESVEVVDSLTVVRRRSGRSASP